MTCRHFSRTWSQSWPPLSNHVPFALRLNGKFSNDVISSSALLLLSFRKQCSSPLSVFIHHFVQGSQSIPVDLYKNLIHICLWCTTGFFEKSIANVLNWMFCKPRKYLAWKVSTIPASTSPSYLGSWDHILMLWRLLVIPLRPDQW